MFRSAYPEAVRKQVDPGKPQAMVSGLIHSLSTARGADVS